MTGERFNTGPWSYIALWLAGIPVSMLLGDFAFGAAVMLGWLFTLVVLGPPVALVALGVLTVRERRTATSLDSTPVTGVAVPPGAGERSRLYVQR